MSIFLIAVAVILFVAAAITIIMEPKNWKNWSAGSILILGAAFILWICLWGRDALEPGPGVKEQKNQGNIMYDPDKPVKDPDLYVFQIDGNVIQKFSNELGFRAKIVSFPKLNDDLPPIEGFGKGLYVYIWVKGGAKILDKHDGKIPPFLYIKKGSGGINAGALGNREEGPLMLYIRNPKRVEFGKITEVEVLD